MTPRPTPAGPVGAWLHGSSGRMGKEIQKAFAESRDRFRLVGGSDRVFEGETFYQGRTVTPELLGPVLQKDGVQVVLDFSTPEGNALLLEAVIKGNVRGLRVLIGTTGISADQIASWHEAAKVLDLGILVAPNTSLGVLMTAKAALFAAKPLARLGFDVEIVETHHRHKKDAPSGTARFLAQTIVDGVEGLRVTTDRVGERLPGEVGVHSVRGGGVFGEHEVRLISENEEITISHRAFSRALFATGALVLAGWLARQKSGAYGLLDVDVGALSP